MDARTARIATRRAPALHEGAEPGRGPGASMEAIGKLTGAMAHDFNNLLGIVIGNLDLLNDRPADPETKELVREALDAALRGAELTQGLLAFARRQPLQPERIDPNTFVERVGETIDGTLGGNFDIRLDLDDKAWPIFADPAQLETSVIAVVANARDAMPNGGIVFVSTGNRILDQDYTALFSGLAAGEYGVIEISDTGAGMTPEVMNQVFEPFFTTKEQGQGPGLGLSMVFGFMKQSEGHINVYSEPGIGTTVRLFLPRAEGEGRAVYAQAATAPEPRGSETVLVVEDNAGMRRVVTRQLKELGYRVLEAEDGIAALEIIDSEDVNLLFTDVVMPGGMRGYDLAHTALERQPGVKVVLTSGFPEAKLAGTGWTPDTMRLLSKPYRKADLARTLREALDR